MNQQIAILYQLQETGSGKLYLAEEKVQNNVSIKYYAFDLQQLQNKGYLIEEDKFVKKSKKRSYFRNYLKMHLNPPLFLFEHYLDGDFLDQKIIENFRNKKSFEKTEIQSYLKQLLEALFQLHQTSIPGRLFSVQNILLIKSTQKIVLMDFGFGPNIKQDNLDILAPPEFLEKLIQKNSDNLLEFDLKFDSWLVGAFLYNLIKLRSINYFEGKLNYQDRCKYDQLEQYYEYLKKIEFIECKTQRYNPILCEFVQSLLTCNKDKRLSFFDIYQHPYVRSLQIDGIKEYEDFYSKQKDIIDYFKIAIESDKLNMPLDSYNNSNQSSASNSSQNSRQTQQQRVKITEIIQSLDYCSVIMKQPFFSNKRFDSFWLKIQLDYLKCYILADTEQKILSLFPKYKLPFDQVIAYYIKKMHYLVLKEINFYLNSDTYQNKSDQDWESFLLQYQKELLKQEEVIQYLENLKKDLISIFNLHCNLRDQSKIPEKLRTFIHDDQSRNLNINISSIEFYVQGYSEAVDLLRQNIYQLIISDEKNQELFKFMNQISLCVSITTSFNQETFQEQFQGLYKENETVKPKDLVNYIKFGDQKK
ncbi:unnamed protein product [Paramecium sonneborni]|uniref:Protein kinase domain-containing protein n=1 Tax=Paramecium sonneborni TaxID=65129 RepID=A0A8S1M9J0_9CILI|nr:unnamed protein product [Paramecium sonneborni]